MVLEAFVVSNVTYLILVPYILPADALRSVSSFDA